MVAQLSQAITLGLQGEFEISLGSEYEQEVVLGCAALRTCKYLCHKAANSESSEVSAPILSADSKTSSTK